MAGFKLHVVINEKGEIQGVMLTRDNVDDKKPVPDLTKKLTDLLFGDKGYIQKGLFLQLLDRNLKLVTKIKKRDEKRINLSKSEDFSEKKIYH